MTQLPLAEAAGSITFLPAPSTDVVKSPVATPPVQTDRLEMPMKVGSLPSVSLIVLNWNGRRFLDACLNSLADLDYPGPEIILVDNGSTDGSATYVAVQHPSVHVIRSPFNLGYAGGMNVGIAHSTGDIVILLNNDIIVPREWLREFIGGICPDERIGVAGCKLYYADGVTLQHAGGYVVHPRGTTGHYGYRQRGEGSCDTPTDVEYVTGAAMAIRRPFLSMTRGLDPGYEPIYYEDVDICYRAREMGWRVVYIPRAELIHLESATMVRDSPSYLRNLHRGRLRFVLKWTPTEQFVDEFVPAELDWLGSGAGAIERHIVASVYKLSIPTVPSLRMPRLHEEADEEGIQWVIRGLAALWQQAKSADGRA